MQGLPKTIDLTPLIGCRIQGISIHKFGVQLLFDDKDPSLRISIESDVIFSDPQGQVTFSHDEFPKSGSSLWRLIDLTVEKAARRDDGGLVLNMSSDIRLEILNNSPVYEAFQIYLGKDIIVG